MSKHLNISRRRIVATLLAALACWGLMIASSGTVMAQFCPGCTGNSTYEIRVGPNWYPTLGSAITTERITSSSGGTTTQGHTTASGSTSTSAFNSGFGGTFYVAEFDLRTNAGTILGIYAGAGTHYYPTGITFYDPNTGLLNYVCYKITVTCCSAGYNPTTHLCLADPCTVIQIETVNQLTPC